MPLIPHEMLEAIDEVDGELDHDCPCSPMARRIVAAVMRCAELALEGTEPTAALLLNDWRGQIDRLGGGR